jgi:hypothetical protein
MEINGGNKNIFNFNSAHLFFALLRPPLCSAVVTFKRRELSTVCIWSGVYILENPPHPLGGIPVLADVIWGEHEKGEEKKGKCERKGRKDNRYR